VVAAGLRTGWVVYRYSGRPEATEYPDEAAYLLSARSVAAGEGLIDEFGYRATYMPGYPLFLALGSLYPGGLMATRIVQALLAALVAPATFWLAREWGRWVLGNGAARGVNLAAVGGGLAAAVDPFLVFFSGLLLTEALYAVLLVGAWAAVVVVCRSLRSGQPAGSTGTRWALLAGAALWACLMLRPAAVVILLAALVSILVSGRFRLSAGRCAVGMLVVVMCGLLPWAVRNRLVLGEWRWLTTRGGISLYDGVQPGAEGASDLAHTKQMPRVRDMGELEWDRHFRHQAWSIIREDPARIIRLTGRKLMRTWSLTPNVEQYRSGPLAWVGAAWMVVILAGAVVGWSVYRREVAAWLVLLMPVLATSGLHMIFVGSVRYRVPVMPMLMVLAAYGFATLVVRRAQAGKVGG
jgi:hypothetical protein